MSEDKNFKKNPMVFRAHLHDKAKESFDTMSYTQFKEVCPTLTCMDARELHGHLLKQMHDDVCEHINNAFDAYKVEEKINKLTQLEKEAASDTVAWRPDTGVVDLKSLEAQMLVLRKKLLQKKIADVERQVEKQKATITNKRNELKTHMNLLQNYNKNVNK